MKTEFLNHQFISNQQDVTQFLSGLFTIISKTITGYLIEQPKATFQY